MKTIEAVQKGGKWKKIKHLGPKLTEYLNNANDPAFVFRPVGKYKYVGDTKKWTLITKALLYKGKNMKVVMDY